MVASLTHPHDPYAIPQKYWDMYRDEDIECLRIATRWMTADPHSKRLRYVCETDKTPPTDQQIRNARHAYYGAISYVDDAVRRDPRSA